MWLDELVRDPALNEAWPLRWLTAEEASGVHDAWLAAWSASRWGEAWLEQGLTVVRRCRPVAVAATRRRVISGEECSLLIVHDPIQDALRLSWGLTFPPHAAPLAGRTPGELAVALGEALRAPLPLPTLTRRFRMVKVLELQDPEPIFATMTAQEPWMDDGWWGSGCDDDPFAGLGDAPHPLLLGRVRQEAAVQHPARPMSWSVRALGSCAVLTISLHPFGIWVFEVAYDPVTADPEATERLTGGSLFPKDLPIDVAASLMRGGSYVGEGFVDAVRGDQNPWLLAAACALAVEDPATSGRIGELAATFADGEHAQVAAEVLCTFGRWADAAAFAVRAPAVRPYVLEQLREFTP